MVGNKLLNMVKQATTVNSSPIKSDSISRKRSELDGADLSDQELQ
jgi:hypothetical protein